MRKKPVFPASSALYNFFSLYIYMYVCIINVCVFFFFCIATCFFFSVPLICQWLLNQISY